MNTKLLLLLIISSLFFLPTRSETLDTSIYFNRIANDGENLWIATSKGIIKYNKEEDKAYNVCEELGLDTEDVIHSIAIDKSNKLWFSVKNKGVYYYQDGKTYYRKGVYKDDYVRYAFAFDCNDSIWVSAGGYYTGPQYNEYPAGYNTPDTYSPTMQPTIMDMEFDSNNNLWILIYGEYNTLLCHKNGNTYCESVIEGTTLVPSITIDKSNNIWYSVRDAIYYYDTSTHNHTRYWHDTDSNIPAAHFFGSDIDDDGNVWFTSSHYLLRYDGKDFKWWNCYGYHEARSIVCDNNIVWVLMSDDALCKFEDNSFTRIVLKDAVTGIEESSAEESNTKAYVSNGVLYIENSEGVNSVTIYDAMGRTLLTPNPSPVERGEIAIPLNLNVKGLLLVKVNNEAVKVICE